MLELNWCPQIKKDGERCYESLEIFERRVIESTDGPIEHLKARCLARHVFFMPTYCLDVEAESPVTRSGVAKPS